MDQFKNWKPIIDMMPAFMSPFALAAVVVTTAGVMTDINVGIVTTRVVLMKDMCNTIPNHHYHYYKSQYTSVWLLSRYMPWINHDITMTS